MTEAKSYFPEGIASNDAFINRQIERSYLAKRIKSTQHTVLIAPRRYGKTSLVIKVADEIHTPYCIIDLFAAYNETYVQNQIANKVGELALQLLPRVKKAKEKLLSIFQQMKPEISINAFGQKLSLSLSNQPLQDISDTLLKLDETAQQFNKKAVIFLDEFQQISKLKNYHAIEASIRHAVERSKNIAYVFSGSNRHLLNQMFGDSGRPLYRLCQTTSIDRMEKTVYTEHLNKLAKKQWKKTLSTDTLETIFKLTELHPFYMNVLCQLAWEQKQAPSSTTINQLWHEYVITQRRIISHDISELSTNQRKILAELAKKPTKEIQSVDFTATIKIPPSSAQQALMVLERNDLTYKDHSGYYQVLDPAMKYYLATIL